MKIVRLMAAIAVSLALSVSAFAGGHNNPTPPANIGGFSKAIGFNLNSNSNSNRNFNANANINRVSNQSFNANSNVNKARSRSASNANASASAANSAQAGGGSASSRAAGGSSSSVLNYSVPTKQTVKYKGIPNNTPDVVMSNVQPTANCRIPVNLGGSGPGFGIGIGLTAEDPICLGGEAVRIGTAANRPAIANLGEEVMILELTRIKRKLNGESYGSSQPYTMTP